MKLHIAAGIAAAMACALPAGAQINAPDASGYIERARLMYGGANYGGSLDQLGFSSSLSPDAAQEEDAMYYRALSLLKSGRHEALDVMDRFLEKYPASARRVDIEMARGDYYFLTGDYARALEVYRGISDDALNDARSEELRFRKGYCFMLLGENETAVSLFKSLGSSPAYADAARFYRGYIAYSDSNYDEALRLFRQVDTSVSPGDAADYYIAQIQFAQGNYDEALTLARRMLSTGRVPQFAPECNRIAGESLYNLGEESEAIPYLWKYCAETASPQPSAFYILGVSEYRDGNVDNAVKLLQKAIGTHSAMEQSAYLFLGQAYLKRGDKNSALMAFENAYRVDYDREVRETAFYNYAVARMDGGRVPFGNSVALLEDFLRDYPDSRYAADVQNYIITGYMTDNDYEAAIESINTVRNPSENVLRAKQRVLFVLGT
ncbi:MAG: tetratricopeptide repeat protein, partial [Duncaniella sp.]|nr:tetratricopeptide repeat protein [Duncaniella sp.]